MAARQALRLCEAELLSLTRDTADVPQTGVGIRGVQPRISVATARAALRAAGMPPHVAAALRGRLRLIPEQGSHEVLLFQWRCGEKDGYCRPGWFELRPAPEHEPEQEAG
jgi:hypothetical protein